VAANWMQADVDPGGCYQRGSVGIRNWAPWLGGAVGIGAAALLKVVWWDLCLASLLTHCWLFCFLSSSVSCLNGRGRANDFAFTAFEYRKCFDIGDRGTSVCVPASNFVFAVGCRDYRMLRMKNRSNLGVFVRQGRHNKPIHVEFGMKLCILHVLLTHAKFGTGKRQWRN